MIAKNKYIFNKSNRTSYVRTKGDNGNINIYLRATGTVWRCLLPLVDRQPEVRLWNLTMKEVMPMNAYEIVDLILNGIRLILALIKHESREKDNRS